MARCAASWTPRNLKDTADHLHSANTPLAFYGPFREAADSTPAFGDRRSYQMDPANSDEAVRESLLDVEEGADMLMVKPALAYLYVLHRVKEAIRPPGCRVQRQRRIRDGGGGRGRRATSTGRPRSTWRP